MRRGETNMAVAIFAICVAVLLIAVVLWIRASKARREIEQYSISPEGLHAMFASNQEVLLFDVRLPLDLLVDSVIIPGAKRLAPKEVVEDPTLIPKDKDSVIYCTCPSDKTSRMILHRALALGFSRTKFLRGGLEAWKANGFPVERYEKAFHLDTGT
jgi:rhodanese-related sulfurtransferase